MIYIKRYFNWATLGVFIFAAMVVATVATGVFAYNTHRDNAINMELSKRMMAEEMTEKVNSAIELEKKRCGVRGIAKLYIEKHPNVITEQHKADLTKHEEIMLATMSHEEFDASHRIVNGIVEELKMLQQEYDAEQQRIKEEEERKAREAAEAKKAQERQQQNNQQYPSGGGVLTPSGGINWFNGRKETYYNLNMSQVVANAHAMGIQGEYWVRGDGVKMLGNYIMAAASDLPKGTIIETSLGTAIIVDAGCAPGVTDIAVTW